MWSYGPNQKLGQIDRNLHNHAFDDIMSKPQAGSPTCYLGCYCLAKNFQNIFKIFSGCFQKSLSRLLENFQKIHDDGNSAKK